MDIMQEKYSAFLKKAEERKQKRKKLKKGNGEDLEGDLREEDEKSKNMK